MLARTQRGQAAATDAVGFVVNAAQEAWRVTRGLRNRNPGNIDWIANPLQRWRGMVSKEPAGRFGVFDSDANGVRAISKELQRTSQRGARSVYDYIAGIPLADGSRWDGWAPEEENDSKAYARTVAKRIGVRTIDEPIALASVLPEFVAGIVQVENAVQPYSLDELKAWVYS